MLKIGMSINCVPHVQYLKVKPFLAHSRIIMSSIPTVVKRRAIFRATYQPPLTSCPQQFP